MRSPFLYKILRPLDNMFMYLYRPKKIGINNIPKKDGCILVGNHTSKLDPLLVMSCTNRCISYLGKIELFKGMKKYFSYGVGIIPVDRSKKNPEAVNTAINHLKNNGVIGIFPEGTINKTDNIIMPFKYGAVKMAKETGSWIVPFAIKGKYEIFKKNIIIEFGKPYKAFDDIDVENNKLENKVIELLKEKGNGRT